MALWTKFAFYHVLLTASLHFVYGISEYECDTGVLLNERLTTVNVKAPEPDGTKPKLCIFCYDGLERTWMRMFVNPRIIITQAKLKMAPDDLIVYYGHNESEVQTQSESITLFSFNTVLLKEEHSFSPFNKSCIGLSSSKAYRVLFKVKNPELWYIAYIAIGTVVFFFAPTWSRNVVFHYTTGMTVGVLASVLVVMFILTRLMPQRMKTVSYVVMAMSSSACLFMFQYVKNYLQDIIQDHWQYAVGYVLVAAILSFALIYRFGPVTDGRSLNLLCWIMQAVGLFCIYQGTQIPEASAAIILLVLTVYFCPRLVSGWGARFRYLAYKITPAWLLRFKRRLFPTQHRFLTEEEWQKEAEEETRKALEDLKQYCKSPQCDKWSVVRRLKSPTATRFAEFVEGSVHITDAEMDEHEMFVQYGRPRAFDDDDEDVVDNSDAGDRTDAPSSTSHNGRPASNQQDGQPASTQEQWRPPTASQPEQGRPPAPNHHQGRQPAPNHHQGRLSSPFQNNVPHWRRPLATRQASAEISEDEPEMEGAANIGDHR